MPYPQAGAGEPCFVDAPTRRIRVGGTDFAYRGWGATDAPPLVLLNHWGANLDNFDPWIVEGLATGRRVVVLDFRGVGRSGGDASLTVSATARDVIEVIRPLDLGTVDLLGFSFGGFVALDVVLREPDLIRKVILTGTARRAISAYRRSVPSPGSLIIKGLLAVLPDPKTYLFFISTANGRQSAKIFLIRLKERAQDRDKPVTPKVFLRQLAAITTSWCRRKTAPIWRGAFPVQNCTSMRMPAMAAFSSITPNSSRPPVISSMAETIEHPRSKA